MLLTDFPLVNQLAEPTSDGQPDENARENCVVGSLAAALTFLLRRPLNGDQLKDAVYGQGYQGPMRVERFVGWCAALGAVLTCHTGVGADLIAAVHGAIAAGQPVLVTMPSDWNTAPPDPVHFGGFTHVGAACGDGPGWLRVMNPWGGFWQDGADSWWQARLCYGAVWSVRRAAGGAMTIAEFAAANPWVGQPVEQVRTTDFGQECCYTNAILGWKAEGGAFLGDAGRQLFLLRQTLATLTAPPEEIQRALALARAIKAL